MQCKSGSRPVRNHGVAARFLSEWEGLTRRPTLFLSPSATAKSRSIISVHVGLVCMRDPHRRFLVSDLTMKIGNMYQ